MQIPGSPVVLSGLLKISERQDRDRNGRHFSEDHSAQRDEVMMPLLPLAKITWNFISGRVTYFSGWAIMSVICQCAKFKGKYEEAHKHEDGKTIDSG